MIYPVGKDKNDFELNWYDAQPFGSKTDYGYHEGADLNLRSGGDSDLGQPCVAICDGIVTSVHEHINSNNFGRHLHIKHEGGFGTIWSHYAHCSEILVKEGEFVKEGQVVARVGKTGTLYSHLHFAIKLAPTGIDGIARDLELLKNWTNPLVFIKNNFTQGSTIIEMDIRLKLLDDNNFKTEGDVRGLIGSSVDLPKARVDLENANKTIDQLNHAIEQYKTDLKAETDSFTAHSIACREEKAILLKNVADALGTTQDLPRILQAIQQLVTANENLDKLERKAKEDITTISDLNATILRKEEAYKSLQINRDGLKSTIERIYTTFSKITQISVKDEADLNVAIQTLSGGIKIQEPIILSIINWFKRLWKI